jgi:acetylornithine deacetylase/succinyl-diaminopimelate desuccinylase-like protein
MRKITLLFILISFTSFSQNFEVIIHKGKPISIEHLLQKYIRIPSISGSEKEAGEFIKSVCKENGLHITDYGTENGNYNFAASVFPLESNKPTIVFLNHIDVVPEIKSETNTPYSGEIKNNTIYGRGAYDNKGVALMQLHSILQYSKSTDLVKSKYNVAFLAVSCEETQCDGGIKYVIDNHLEELNPVVVIGEGPSELTTLMPGKFKNPIYGVSVAHKRAFWLKLEIEIETSGHGSITPIEYSNKKMVKSLAKLTKKKSKIIYNDLNVSLLKFLGTHKKGIEKLVLKHPRLFKPFIVSRIRKQPELAALFTNTVTLTNIYTDSDAYNIVPTRTTALLDCRLLPQTDEKEFLDRIRKRINNDAIKITITQSMPKTEPSSLDNFFYKNLKSAIIEKYQTAQVLPILLPNMNDLGAFRAKGIPSYASIPINISREELECVHNKNEHLSIPLLYDCSEVYLSFIKKLQGI